MHQSAPHLAERNFEELHKMEGSGRQEGVGTKNFNTMEKWIGLARYQYYSFRG